MLSSLFSTSKAIRIRLTNRPCMLRHCVWLRGPCEKCPPPDSKKEIHCIGVFPYKFNKLTNWFCLTPTDFWSRSLTQPIGNESAPIQLAQYRFRGLAISKAEILIYIFSNKINERIFFKQHSETATVWNADCSLRKKIIASFVIIFGTLSFPICF